MNIVILLYPRFAATDALGPYEILARLPGARVRFVAAQAGPVTADTGMLTVLAEAAYPSIERADVLILPGGPPSAVPVHDEALLSWVRRIDEGSQWTGSVCTGALLLGAAGLLQGKRATTHWAEHAGLRRFGAQPVAERVVFDGKLVTGAGVTAGYDMALQLAARIAGPLVAQAIQLGLEYAPEPPFDSGRPDRAPAEVLEALMTIMAAEGESPAATAASR
ncbi:MAG: DJ-1/PfpI family protein [Polyangia bacterium]